MIHPLPFSSVRFLTWILLQVCLGVFFAEETAFCQSLEEAVAGPYRRVFVRDSDLPLEGYRAMDRDSFRAMLEKRRKLAADLDPNAPDHETELRSFHAQVRLVGADLVSERSRLRWKWDPTSVTNKNGVRKLLAPWSPAISPSVRGVGSQPSNALSPPAWMYDLNGQPMVRVTSDEEWFAWTLRPLATSTPNQLRYAPSFPRTIDGCLVLQLPKNFRVVDANVVVRLAENWNQVTERLGEWPDALAAESIPELNATDAFWLLELSGRDQVNFSILVSPNRGLDDALASSDASGLSWNRLIARQSVAHVATAQHIKTTCDWEWFDSTTLDRTFRIRVPDGMRLRNLKWNERETSPRFVDRVIELAIPTDESGGASRAKVSAEFLSSVSDLLSDSVGIVKIPPVECSNAYVVAGTTSLASEGSLELRNIRSDSGRLESVRDANKQLERLDFSWFQAPPEISFAIAPKAIVDSAEILTQLSTEADRLIAVVKMQWSPWHVSAPGLIRVEGPWSVETTQLNHPGLEWIVQEPDAGSSATILRIEPRGPVDAGPIPIELLLTRSGVHAVDSAIPRERPVTLPGRSSVQALVIEPSYASRLDYGGDFSDDLCDEESLTPWQRERLPRLGRFLLYRMPDGLLPNLRWKEDPILVQCHIATTLNDDGDRIRAEHLLELRHGVTHPQSVRVQMPGEWRWEWESPSGWKTFQARADPSGTGWHLEHPSRKHFSANSDSNASSPWRFRAIAHREKSQEPWRLPLPRLSSNQAATYVLKSDPILQVIPDQARGEWNFDNDGNLVFQWQDPLPNSVPLNVQVLADDHGERNRGWISRSELHVAVDAQGHQRAVLDFEAHGLPKTSLSFGLTVPVGWSVEKILNNDANQDTEDITDAFSVRCERDRCQIFRRLPVFDTTDTQSQVSLILAGPRLERSGHGIWGIFPAWSSMLFSWPSIGWESPFPKPRRILWTPDSIQAFPTMQRLVDEGVETGVFPSRTQGFWSAWRWSAEAASWLGWGRTEREEVGQAGGAIRMKAIPPRSLLPGSFALGWKRTLLEKEAGNADSTRTELFVLRPEPAQAGYALWLVIAVFLSYFLLQRVPWICLLLAVVATFAGHWFPEWLAIWFRAAWVGFAVGALIYLIVWTTASPGARPAERHLPSEPWQPWNELGMPNVGLSDSHPRGAVNASLGILLSILLGLPMFAQDRGSRERGVDEHPFDVLIPMDDTGKPAGDLIYIPDRIASATEETPSVGPPPDRDAYVISARHSLRFDARSISFGNTEQPCIHTYEVWVGQAGVSRPIRIPFSSDRSRLSRFLVDGAEVASSRLTKNDRELIWYPDRPGRRTLQVESQIRIRLAEREKNDSDPLEAPTGDLRTLRAWSIDAPILPAGNAILEIETDAGWSIDFRRSGRFSNPSIGKFSIQLGNQDRITGEIAPDSAAASSAGGIVVPEAGPSGSSDSPQMNTELFIDRDQLIARTVVEYPRPNDAPDELELEADLQWQPVGNLWGEAKLIDIRPGSTLDRRRYIVRWISDASSSPGKRNVTTTWIPVGSANLRNLLFAECRDRRVRANTLRYARTAGSAWILEGINTWIPSINTKERIEWMDLYERPIATSLRIPINGGFGVLRQQPAVNLLRGRVFHQAAFGSDRATFRSRVELANPAGNRRPLILSIPSQFAVAEVLSRSTPLAYIDWLVGERRYIQVFIDRELGDVSDLLIISERDLSGLSTLSSPLPVLTAEELSIADQFVEISADPSWQVRLSSQSDPAERSSVRGRGLEKSLVSSSVSGLHESEWIQLDRMNGAWAGLLTARILSVSENELRWELRFQDKGSVDAKPRIAMSLPMEMSRDYKSDAMLRELPSHDPTYRLIQIQPDWSDGDRDCSFTVEWVGDPAAFQEGSWMDRIRVDSEPGLECQRNQDRTGVDSDRATDREGSGPTEISPCQSLEVHRLESDGLLSSWWIDLATWDRTRPPTLEWVLTENTRVRWISINGRGVPWNQDGTRLSINMPLIAIPVRIDLWSDLVVSPEDRLGVQAIPDLIRGDGGCRKNGWLVVQGEIRGLDGRPLDLPIDSGISLRREVCLRNLEILSALVRQGSAVASTAVRRPMLWHRWCQSILRETSSLLMEWGTDTESPDSDAYQGMVTSYLGLLSGFEVQRWRPHDVGFDDSSLREGLDASLCRRVLERAAGERGLPGGEPHGNRVLAPLSMALVVVGSAWIWRMLGESLRRKAWWPLGLIGMGAWLLTGSWVPALILISMGLFLAVDSYWILNGRFRQSGTRVPR